MKTAHHTAWHSLPGPENITRVCLPNGITILTRTNFNSPSVVLSGYLASGSIFDPREKLGLANFSTLMFMRGTQKRDHQKLYDDLETAGASFGVGASVHNTNFGGRCLAEDVPLILNLASEVLREPVFPVEHVERLRTQILTGLAIRAQDTAEMASLTFDARLFNDHPYALPEDGFPETIQAITREDMVAYHRNHIGPKGMVITLVGAISPEQAVEEISKAFSFWENPLQTPPEPLPLAVGPKASVREHIALPGKSQTDLVLGTLGPRRSDPEYMAASLGNNVLGQFGMMGRIGDIVREQAGLAYYASTSLNAWISGGSWEVTAGVNPVNLQRAIDLILSEIQRFTREPVTVDELRDSQTNFIGRLPLSLESNSGVAGAILNMERFQLGLDYYQRYASLVEKITPEDVLAVARRYLGSEAVITISSGPELSPAEA